MSRLKRLAWSGVMVCAVGSLYGLGGTEGTRAEVVATAEARARQETVEEKRHLGNIRQLTFGRKNAEAYFSFDGDQLIFQSTNNWDTAGSAGSVTSEDAKKEGLGCYQMYTMDLASRKVRLVSTGQGGTTCGYFYPGGRRVLYSSTHLAGPGCPPKTPRGPRYRWALHDYDIFTVRIDRQEMQRLTFAPGYDAEATIAPDGRTIVFTSMRDGDLELYTMRLDGTRLTRLTREVGYDGGAFFSPDSRRIVYRASHPKTKDEIEAYQRLLKDNLVEPSQLEIFVMNADGSGRAQVTKNGASNFAPFFHPDGRRIIFSSNLHSRGAAGKAPSKRPTFHLYMVGDDGKGLEQITDQGSFNSFPMFSPDGAQLVWVSDRNATERGEFNIFLADWMP